VLAAVGAKLHVAHAWYEDINRLKTAYVLHVDTEFASPPAILSSITTRPGRRVRFPECLGVLWSRRKGGRGVVDFTD